MCSKIMSINPSFKDELLIIASTAYYNLTTGLLIILLGLEITNKDWYKILYIFVGLLIMSYPFFHLRDRLKDRKTNVG